MVDVPMPEPRLLGVNPEAAFAWREIKGFNEDDLRAYAAQVEAATIERCVAAIVVLRQKWTGSSGQYALDQCLHDLRALGQTREQG